MQDDLAFVAIAGVQIVHAVEAAQQRRFAAAGRTDQRRDLAFGEPEVDVFECLRRPSRSRKLSDRASALIVSSAMLIGAPTSVTQGRVHARPIHSSHHLIFLRIRDRGSGDPALTPNGNGAANDAGCKLRRVEWEFTGRQSADPTQSPWHCSSDEGAMHPRSIRDQNFAIRSICHVSTSEPGTGARRVRLRRRSTSWRT